MLSNVNTTLREIHMKGGSVLKAGRGGFDAERICDNLEKTGINMIRNNSPLKHTFLLAAKAQPKHKEHPPDLPPK